MSLGTLIGIAAGVGVLTALAVLLEQLDRQAAASLLDHDHHPRGSTSPRCAGGSDG